MSFVPLPPAARESEWELAAEAITLRIRWLGVLLGYALVNLVGRETNASLLNGILLLGLVYASVDHWYSLRGRVFLGEWPLFVSAMEAVFIGLLCHCDTGIDSPFRFYYLLSLLVCAIRHSPQVTLVTYGMHAVSYGTLAFRDSGTSRADLTALAVLVVQMGWVTWASTALASLLKIAGRRLVQLNRELQQNQTLLEHRIEERTAELRQSQALVIQQEKQAAFGLLAAGIAHEVGNPLTAISSLVQMLRRRNVDDYARERLAMVDDQLRRIQRTLRELVDFSRPASSAPALCDIQEILGNALNIAKYYKRRKNRHIVIRSADDVPMLRHVRDQLVQVFLNLVLNALDATEEGGTIEIVTECTDGRIRVTVRDDGHGISAEDRDRVFEPYFTTKETGTGLGLFVCKRLVEQWADGRIELTETSPRGTAFVVSLACAERPSESDASEPESARESQAKIVPDAARESESLPSAASASSIMEAAGTEAVSPPASPLDTAAEGPSPAEVALVP